MILLKHNNIGDYKIKNILKVENIEKYYVNKGNITKAIDNISFRIDEGEFVGIMGPSGSVVRQHFLTVYKL